jgi:4-hydroxy-tetrahydrodipicolinate reductase
LRAVADAGMAAAVIGTTGFTAADEAQIEAAAERLAIVKAGNFSLGVALVCALVQRAAQALPAHGWDIEILEAHHRHKADAPSGTALMLAEAAARGRGAPLDALRLPPRQGQTGPRPEGGIGFAVLRGGGVIGRHEASFFGAHEVVTLSHEAMDRSVFADGALTAAEWAVRQPPGLYGVADVLGL